MGQQLPNRHRLIIVRFTRFCDREATMRNISKLQCSHIYVNEDLYRASQEIKNAQLPQLKQAKAEGKIAYFRHTNLIAKDRKTSTNIEVVRPRTSEDSNETVSTDVTGAGARAGCECQCRL